MYSVTEQFVAWLAGMGWAASTRPPAGAPHDPSEFVTVERTGGGVSDMVDRPLMAVQAWASTEARAEEIALAVRDAALMGATRPRGVHSLRVEAGPYPFFDENTLMPRYQVVFDTACQLSW